jgi:adenine-specific DNA-methyltransferase
MPAGRKPKTLWADGKYSATTYGTKLLLKLFKDAPGFSYPKSIHLIKDAIGFWTDTTSYVLDYFAGSGTSGHAVLSLNRDDEDSGQRKFILVEMARYFATVLKPRITKIIYSPDWKHGRAQTHNKSVSALVKYFALESYEDALNNLPAPKGELFTGMDAETLDAMITYSLDLQMGPNLLNLDSFRDPWGYTINAQPAGEEEIKPHAVDLVETFNYLLGLKVHAYGPLERYAADFEQAAHEDGLGRLKVSGRLKPDKGGTFVFQRVEGELNDGNDTRVLVIWRKLSDDPEKDAAVLEAWMRRHREATRERSAHRDYHFIYINGPVTLPQPTAEIRTVFPLEQTFKDRMFADTDGGQDG